MYYFLTVLRSIRHRKRLDRFRSDDFELDPERMVNRALCGTDYHPDDVTLRQYDTMLSYLNRMISDNS